MEILQNDKIISCPPLKKVVLDYKKSNKIVKHISLLYDKELKFEIPLEKICTLRHIINNEISIISDNAISENRSINIHLYSPIIFKNKSIYSLQIKIENKEYGNTLIELNKSSITGIPLDFINKNTTFYFILIKDNSDKNNDDDYSEKYNLNQILIIKISEFIKK